jgi:putative heme-binding domain-containing protein
MRPTTLFLCAVLLCLAASSWKCATVLAQAVAAKPDPIVGKKVFQDDCSACHGLDGGGGRGPSLHRPKLNHAADEKSLRAVLENGIAPGMPAAWFLTEEEIADVASYVLTLGTVPQEKVPGDPVRGATVYTHAHCDVCHTLGGQGNTVGPDLTDVGARRGAGVLLQTLEHPEGTIPEGFLLIEAVPLSGNTVRGIRVNEDSFSIQLRDPSGRFYSFRKADLKELKKLRGMTPMPSYQKHFSATEIEDLVAYLAAQRGQS